MAVRASQERTVVAIEAAARQARAGRAMLVTLGGDHSIAYPLVRACDDCANLGIIQLDAHLDFADDVQGVPISSSSPLRRISELLRAIARHGRIVGIDVVEVSPPLDPAGTTALAAAQALMWHC